jgi:hypothetical protein
MRKIIAVIIVILLLVPIFDVVIHYCQGTEDKCEMSCCNETEKATDDMSLSRSMNCNCCSLTETKQIPIQPVILSKNSQTQIFHQSEIIFSKSNELNQNSFLSNIIPQSNSPSQKTYITISVFRI